MGRSPVLLCGAERPRSEVAVNFTERLNFHIVTLEKDHVKAVMPVNESVHQSFGYLHGGATIALLESVASEGAALNCGEDEIPFGVDVHVAHRSNMREGEVTGESRLALEERTSKGYLKQTWDVVALNEEGGTVSEGTVICLIVPRP